MERQQRRRRSSRCFSIDEQTEKKHNFLKWRKRQKTKIDDDDDEQNEVAKEAEKRRSERTMYTVWNYMQQWFLSALTVTVCACVRWHFLCFSIAWFDLLSQFLSLFFVVLSMAAVVVAAETTWRIHKYCVDIKFMCCFWRWNCLRLSSVFLFTTLLWSFFFGHLRHCSHQFIGATEKKWRQRIERNENGHWTNNTKSKCDEWSSR